MRLGYLVLGFALVSGCTRENAGFIGTSVDMSVAGRDLAGADLSSSASDLAGSDGASSGDGGADLAGVCAPDTFLACSGNDAIYCSSSGDTTTTFDCGAACTGTPTGCGQCTADGCLNGAIITCDTVHDKITSSDACRTLQAGAPDTSVCNGNVCAECIGTQVCGDDIDTDSTYSYQCANGYVDLGTFCSYGCDPQTGGCRDVVPANQAAAHLAAASPMPTPTPADSFTCIGTQDVTLPEVIAGASDVLTFDTTLGTISTGSQSFIARWGVPYKPTGSNTNVIVAHVKSLSVDGGALVNVRGARALVILVDGDVDFSGGSASAATQIVVTANGAATTSGHGGAGGGTEGGGGGAGHSAHGAKGGNGSSGTGGGEAGGTYGNAVILEAGGTGGSGAGLSVSNAGNGGAGGGGLQITSCGAINIGANVVVNASGSGGGAGVNKSGVAFAGGGGGAGGTLIFEAASMTLTGMLVTNGGGGGEGADLAGSGVDGTTWGWIVGITVGTVAAGGSGRRHQRWATAATAGPARLSPPSEARPGMRHRVRVEEGDRSVESLPT